MAYKAGPARLFLTKCTMSDDTKATGTQNETKAPAPAPTPAPVEKKA